MVFWKALVTSETPIVIWWAASMETARPKIGATRNGGYF